MKNKCYIITEDRGQQFNAGSKVYADNTKILIDRGAIEIKLDIKSYSSHNFIVRKFFRLLEYFKNIKKISYLTHKDSIIIVQYPFYTFFFYILLRIWMALSGKRLNFLFIIIDLESIRFPNIHKYRRLEKRFILSASYIISHNPNMSNFLKSKFLYKAAISNINAFDYLIDATALSQNKIMSRGLSQTIAFAGNLEKSKFIYRLGELGDNILFNLYGKEIPDMEFPSCCHYSGCYSPDKLPLALDASFGLIWDGDSVETCHGNFGEYLRYNTPHKLSLYIASEMPVIVWEESAVAEFIEKHNIGFTVKSLLEISYRILKMSEFEYSQIISNIRILSKKIRSGEMLVQSVQEVLHYR